MDEKEVVTNTEAFVRKTLEGEGTGHDWWHIHRVRNTALELAREEQADLFVVELAALLHDIADWKFHGGDDKIAAKKTREWLESQGVNQETIAHVCDIVDNISFKGAGVGNKINTTEGKIVQDADRLDALGAIGIARAFAYGGSKSRPLYDPEQQATMHQSFDEYKKGASSTVHHFYEKLLLLKDRMNTEAGKKRAATRHAFIERYLQQFHAEWDGQDN